MEKTRSINMPMIWQIEKNGTPAEIVNFIVDIFQIMDIRARVGQKNGVAFIIHTNEKNHSIPHVHAAYGEYSISIAIEDGRLLEGNLPEKEMKRASNWVLSHKEKLQKDWCDIAVSAIAPMTVSKLG